MTVTRKKKTMQQQQQPFHFPDILSSLRKAGRSLEKCNANLSFCGQSLDVHTRQVPRINRALSNSQFFELVSVSEIRAAQYQLTSELEPQIKELVKQTEIGLLKLHKREQMLRLNISKRRNLQWDDDIVARDEEKEEEDDQQAEGEKTGSKTDLITNRKLEEREHELQQLRSTKNSLLKELERLDQQIHSQHRRL
ncbi:hypothetical protein VP01_369g4 [Puccinia sorghi]|uniref:DASH complex subunit SPC19 n=1 Tax=Puccinia sorghi TaxID=27349 RepID=A0A0L6UU76_9BASI|nr:hypothetical protein VP01_369g4 [Puccinia sorghi]